MPASVAQPACSGTAAMEEVSEILRVRLSNSKYSLFTTILKAEHTGDPCNYCIHNCSPDR